MNTNEIIEGNKLIAEFMGIKPTKSLDHYSYADAPFFFVREITEEKVIEAIANYVKYYTSWDWLRPVIDKIISTIGVKTIDECSADEWYITTGITRMIISTPINEAYARVIKYIKWYNKQNK